MKRNLQTLTKKTCEAYLCEKTRWLSGPGRWGETLVLNSCLCGVNKQMKSEF